MLKKSKTSSLQPPSRNPWYSKLQGGLRVMPAMTFLLLFFISVIPAHANSDWVKSENIRARIVDESGALGIEIEAAPKWHFYYKIPGDSGLATTFDFKGSENIMVEEVIFPEYKIIKEYEFSTNAYEGINFFPVKAKIGDNPNIKLNIVGAVCHEICIPFDLKFDYAPKIETTNKPGTSLYILGLALLAGLILNIMPCVLPVLSLKVLSVLKQSGAQRKHARVNFLATAAGIISSFLALAVLTISLKSAGMAVGWGLHFQSPIFVGVLMFITILFAASLFGLFHLNPPSWLSGTGENKNNIAGNFLSGVLATLLGTSCTAPVLVTAVGYALAGSNADVILIFLIMGIGMALPFLLFAARPNLVNFLPKPGKWMVKVKYALGVLLLVTAAWLGTILYAQSVTPTEQTQVQAQSAGWRKFNLAEVNELAKANVVFVDITAKWCVNCQTNKATVTDTEEMQQFFSANKVFLMQGDMTRPAPELLSYIKSFGRYGIPVNVVYGPKAPKGILLGALLSKDAVKKAVLQAK